MTTYRATSNFGLKADFFKNFTKMFKISLDELN